jgi:hypothetical protein
MRWRLPGIAAAVICLSGCDDASLNYATLHEVRSGGWFDAGCIPDILPASAYDISYSNDSDLDRAEGEFWFDPVDFPNFAAQFDSVDQPFEFAFNGQIWSFFCDSAAGHCYYSTR